MKYQLKMEQGKAILIPTSLSLKVLILPSSSKGIAMQRKRKHSLQSRQLRMQAKTLRRRKRLQSRQERWHSKPINEPTVSNHSSLLSVVNSEKFAASLASFIKTTASAKTQNRPPRRTQHR